MPVSGAAPKSCCAPAFLRLLSKTEQRTTAHPWPEHYSMGVGLGCYLLPLPTVSPHLSLGNPTSSGPHRQRQVGKSHRMHRMWSLTGCLAVCRHSIIHLHISRCQRTAHRPGKPSEIGSELRRLPASFPTCNVRKLTIVTQHDKVDDGWHMPDPLGSSHFYHYWHKKLNFQKDSAAFKKKKKEEKKKSYLW